MTVTLENVVPWGRSLAEYREMFGLTDDDLQKRILGCADGPASFNAEVTAVSGNVISIDPVYAFSGAQIEQRVKAVYPVIMGQVEASVDDFVWTTIDSPETLGQMRMAAMTRFLADYEEGRANGRYLPHPLPILPFADHRFELALCSHFLFLYSDHLTTDFHITAVREMVRVAGEVRIFPLLDLDGTTSPHLQPVMEALKGDGKTAVVQTVSYEFQRGGNQLLRIQ